jgi:hypothetical protein
MGNIRVLSEARKEKFIGGRGWVAQYEINM